MKWHKGQVQALKEHEQSVISLKKLRLSELKALVNLINATHMYDTDAEELAGLLVEHIGKLFPLLEPYYHYRELDVTVNTTPASTPIKSSITTGIQSSEGVITTPDGKPVTVKGSIFNKK